MRRRWRVFRSEGLLEDRWVLDAGRLVVYTHFNETPVGAFRKPFPYADALWLNLRRNGAFRIEFSAKICTKLYLAYEVLPDVVLIYELPCAYKGPNIEFTHSPHLECEKKEVSTKLGQCCVLTPTTSSNTRNHPRRVVESMLKSLELGFFQESTTTCAPRPRLKLIERHALPSNKITAHIPFFQGTLRISYPPVKITVSGIHPQPHHVRVSGLTSGNGNWQFQPIGFVNHAYPRRKPEPATLAMPQSSPKQ